ncbi:hypothetical protein BLNAU_10103 [Blattamonas nauphoetae]|uniref:Uncharacterized protein n=1 Tax=Blattamonas nauphoetae TaxID=2049346 RepID=A0ABQ9XU07_9EUKA|nr:hypothetical protein BLNAU_10103 [Blattamonas nauphoetae]
MEHERVVKVLTIGDDDANITHLVYHLAHDRLTTFRYFLDFFTQTVRTGEEKVKFQLWDCSPSLRSPPLSRAWYRGTSVLLIAYNPIIKTTFTNVRRWFDDADCQLDSPAIRMLVEHTSSRNRPREVPIGAGQAMAESMGILFGEVDSSSGEFNDDLLELLANEIVSKFPLSDVPPSSHPPNRP